MTKTIKKLFTDMIPVVLGVLIALFINNWNEQSKNEKFLNSVLDSIDKELTEDLGYVKSVLKQQNVFLDTVGHYMEDEQVSILDCISKAGGLKVLTSKNSSWWSFLNEKIDIVGYETVASLGDIEESQNFIFLKMNKLMDHVLEHTESTESSKKKMALILLLNLMESEEELLTLYEERLGMPTNDEPLN